MTRPRIVILNAGFGSLGHAVLAANYQRLLAQHGCEATLLDVVQADGGASIAAVTALYSATLRHMPGVWRFLYSSWSRLPGMESFRLSLMTRRFHQTEKTLRRLDPTTILTTHPLATAIASRLKSRGALRSRLIAAFWDWHFQRFWCFPAVDQYLVNTPRQRQELIAMGIAPNRITLSGVLVSPEYCARVPAAEARARLQLPADGPVVLVLGGGRGWGLEALLQAVAQQPAPVCAVILCGSAQRQARLQQMLAAHGSGAAAIRLLAFEPDPALYFHAADVIVSKPSGLSTAQAFACGTPVLATSPEPGHEEANLAELTGSGVVLVPRANENPAAAIRRLLDDPAALQQTAAQARQFVALDTKAIALDLLVGAGCGVIQL